jgi:uncharacterized membrane protein
MSIFIVLMICALALLIPKEKFQEYPKLKVIMISIIGVLLVGLIWYKVGQHIAQEKYNKMREQQIERMMKEKGW